MIIDDYRRKRITIQTDHGQVHVGSNFSMEYNQPIPGFVKITDIDEDRIFWFNFNAIVWIGPAND